MVKGQQAAGQYGLDTCCSFGIWTIGKLGVMVEFNQVEKWNGAEIGAMIEAVIEAVFPLHMQVGAGSSRGEV